MPRIDSYPSATPDEGSILLGVKDDQTRTFTAQSVADVASPEGWKVFKRRFTGSELVSTFNGNADDKITLVTVPANHLVEFGFQRTTFKFPGAEYTISGNDLGIYANTSPVAPGGTDQTLFLGYNFGSSALREQINGFNLSVYKNYELSRTYYSYNFRSSNFLGKDIVLGQRVNATPYCNILEAGEDVILTFTYRLIDLS